VRPAPAGLLAGALLAGLPAAAQVPTGYAFAQPAVLAQQLVWGRLHAVRLLALACRERGDAAAALAYADWLDRHWPPIRAAHAALSRHYFHREEAPLPAIAAALGLKPELALGDTELAAACATLPAALAAPRHDLERLYAEQVSKR
jgi:hypothetical protein